MKILVVLSRFPYPLEKGDKLRAYHQIKYLSQKNEIILFALTDIKVKQESIDHLKQYCKDIKIVRLSPFNILINLFASIFKSIPFQVGYFYSSKSQKKFNSFCEKHHPEHIYCQLIRTAEYVNNNNNNNPKTLDYMDVFSKGIERRIASAPFYLKPIFKIELKRLLKYEHMVFNRFKNKTIISEQDKNLIPHPDKQTIAVIENGVDYNYFKPVEQKKEFDILFNGNMNYPPNIESAEYLVKEILPLITKEIPNIKVLISGANPADRILNLQSQFVTVSGWTDDVRTNFSKSKILLAPMLTSTGLQNKLLEAMAMQLPCITSTLANNALGAIPNTDILVADTPEDYASHVIFLLKDDTRSKEIASHGYQFVTRNYNWDEANEKLEKLINS